MGGYGSGRWTRYASKTDDFSKIDLSELRRWGSLEPGRTGTLTWSIAGEVHSKVGYHAHQDGFRLVYRHKRAGADEWTTIDEFIPYTYTGQNLGGQRRWFKCPGCGGRARVLYGGERYRCRKCYGLVYDCQYSPWPDGIVNRAQRIRMQLGGEPGLAEPFPPKPKGMHWKTYERLREADWDVAVRLDRLLASVG